MSIEQEEIILAFLLPLRDSLGSNCELVQGGFGKKYVGWNINNVHTVYIFPRSLSYGQGQNTLDGEMN